MGLRDLRLAKGYSLHKLAELSGVNYMKIHQIEHRKIQPENIRLSTAIKLASALGCDPQDLIKPDEPPLTKTDKSAQE